MNRVLIRFKLTSLQYLSKQQNNTSVSDVGNIYDSIKVNIIMEDIKFLENTLRYIMATTQIHKDVVVEIRKHIDKVGSLNIEIHPNEHVPCHFHIKSANIDAIFRIDNCELIKGKISKNDIKKVQYWYNSSNNKQKLIEIWNKTRPTNCIVGKYKEEI